MYFMAGGLFFGYLVNVFCNKKVRFKYIMLLLLYNRAKRGNY